MDAAAQREKPLLSLLPNQNLSSILQLTTGTKPHRCGLRQPTLTVGLLWVLP